MPSPFDAVVIDSSVLLGANSPQVVAGAALGYYRAYWSSWIVAEYVRNRIEWTTRRATRDAVDKAETVRRLESTRAKVNSAISYLSRVLISVDYHTAHSADLSWLTDPDDHPIMQTVLATGAGVLVTDNSGDFPGGETRNGILLLGSDLFLPKLYGAVPEAKQAVREYLERGR